MAKRLKVALKVFIENRLTTWIFLCPMVEKSYKSLCTLESSRTGVRTANTRDLKFRFWMKRIKTRCIHNSYWVNIIDNETRGSAIVGQRYGDIQNLNAPSANGEAFTLLCAAYRFAWSFQDGPTKSASQWKVKTFSIEKRFKSSGSSNFELQNFLQKQIANLKKYVSQMTNSQQKNNGKWKNMN